MTDTSYFFLLLIHHMYHQKYFETLRVFNMVVYIFGHQNKKAENFNWKTITDDLNGNKYAIILW